MFRLIPFMAIAIALYFATVILGRMPLETVLTGFTPPSGVRMELTLSHALLLLGMSLLFVELMTATSPRATSLINHGLSLAVFILCGLAFLLIAGCGTGTFMLLTFLTLIDVVAGYSISIITARRDLAIEKVM
jgi:hypothetical protein